MLRCRSAVPSLVFGSCPARGLALHERNITTNHSGSCECTACIGSELDELCDVMIGESCYWLIRVRSWWTCSVKSQQTKTSELAPLFSSQNLIYTISTPRKFHTRSPCTLWTSYRCPLHPARCHKRSPSARQPAAGEISLPAVTIIVPFPQHRILNSTRTCYRIILTPCPTCKYGVDHSIDCVSCFLQGVACYFLGSP
jgi:hypothetical protein